MNGHRSIPDANTCQIGPFPGKVIHKLYNKHPIIHLTEILCKIVNMFPSKPKCIAIQYEEVVILSSSNGPEADLNYVKDVSCILG